MINVYHICCIFFALFELFYIFETKKSLQIERVATFLSKRKISFDSNFIKVQYFLIRIGLCQLFYLIFIGYTIGRYQNIYFIYYFVITTIISISINVSKKYKLRFYWRKIISPIWFLIWNFIVIDFFFIHYFNF